MTIDTNAIVSITEANQNFSKIARMVDEVGRVVIMKNNVPKYVLYEFDKAEAREMASDNELRAVSENLMERNSYAYGELAK